MITEPENLLVLAILRNNQEVVGHFILYAPEDLHYSYVLDAFVEKELWGHAVVDLTMIQAVKWSKGKGRMELRGETERGFRGWERRWFVKRHSTVIKFDVKDVEKVLWSHGRLKGSRSMSSSEVEGETQ